MTDIVDIIVNKLLILPGILIGLSVHEFAHAFVAYKLGDSSQRFQGRLTLDPTKHIDPLGFLFLLLVGFGWAKPVMVNSREFKNPRVDDTLVSLAGPLMNLITAVIFTVVLGAALIYMSNGNQITDIIITIITGIIQINLVLMVFNLIPIPPLDGHHILGNIGGAPVWNFYYKNAEILRFALMALIIFGGTKFIISPIVNKTYSFLISTMIKVVSGML